MSVPKLKPTDRVAVIGTGIAGMGASYFLTKILGHKNQLTVFEKRARTGGHTHSHQLTNVDESSFMCDSGFIVWNKHTYPNLIKLFAEIGVAGVPTDMSFSVKSELNQLEYSSRGLTGLFAQRKNLYSREHWKLLLEIMSFNKKCPEVLTNPKFSSYTISDYFGENRWSPSLLNNYFLPMSAAIWSTPPQKMTHFPIVPMIRFFQNHGLLSPVGNHQWYTFDGSSSIYKEVLTSHYADRIRTSSAVQAVEQNGDQVDVLTAQGRESFDYVIIATHANQALKLLAKPTTHQSRLLGAFDYQPNHVCLHQDESVMPKARLAWSAWNYHISDNAQATLTYHMNRLQPLRTNQNYFVTLNAKEAIASTKIIKELKYAHPIFNLKTMEAQSELPKLNQRTRILFAGSYFRYGFHEDAITSGLEAVAALAGTSPTELWR